MDESSDDDVQARFRELARGMSCGSCNYDATCSVLTTFLVADSASSDESEEDIDKRLLDLSRGETCCF